MSVGWVLSCTVGPQFAANTVSFGFHLLTACTAEFSVYVLTSVGQNVDMIDVVGDSMVCVLTLMLGLGTGVVLRRAFA